MSGIPKNLMSATERKICYTNLMNALKAAQKLNKRELWNFRHDKTNGIMPHSLIDAVISKCWWKIQEIEEWEERCSKKLEKTKNET